MTLLSLPDDLLQTAYRPDLGIFVGRWGYQPPAELLPLAYEQLTADSSSSGCRFWLQDIRRRTLNDPNITRWLLTEYFPQRARELGGRLYVAYLTSPALMNTIMQGPSFLPPSAYINEPFVVAFFSEEGQSIQWLREQQVAVAAS